jgi:hypothetical protein
VNCYAAMWAGLYAPVAAFAFFFFDHYDACLFGL